MHFSQSRKIKKPRLVNTHLNMSEKFSIKWNDYESNWIKSISGLRNDTESADVTLISDDKVKFGAHKTLLSSCSDIFKFILKGNTHTNPLLFLSGVSSINLGFILDYIYYGEVNLLQEQLDRFLESAQKLEIKGLLGNNQECQEGSEYDNESYLKNESVQEQSQKDEDCRLSRMDENSYLKVRRDTRRYPKDKDFKQFDVSSMTAEEIELKMNELYQKVDGTQRCMACTYSTKFSRDIMKHIEIHLDGLSYTCPTCNKEFRSTNSLKNHISIYHK